MTNRYGLSRDIPADVKRLVRQRDGFGCVVCGNAVIDYEHFEPEFADARAHDPAGIILLCIGCHGLKTRGRLSKETIDRARRKPKARQKGFSHGAFDVGEECPDILLGNVHIRNTPVILRVRGDDLLTVKGPEETGGPFRISAFLMDGGGRLQLQIIDNEWKSPTSNWDVAVVGPRITIRSGVRDIQLVLRTEPPKRLVVERLNMAHRGFSIECQDGHPTVMRHGSLVLETSGAELDGCQVGIVIDDDGGLALGAGGGSVAIGAMWLNRFQSPEQTSNVVRLFPSKS